MASFFQSVVAIFGGGSSGATNSSGSRRNQAMLSTRDAFSLPSTRDAYRHDSVDGEASTSTYTYPPPPLGGSYGSVPQSSYDLRQSTSPSSSTYFPAARPQPSLLPTHNAAQLGVGGYPNLQRTWQRIRTWLANEYPELGDTLNWGIDPTSLIEIEAQLGFQLPPAVRDSYLVVDGQEAESAAGCNEGLFFGLTLLPLDDVLEEWRFWRGVDNDPATGANVRLRDIMESIPDGWIRKEYSQRGWIPLVTDKAGNYLGVDLSPAEGGEAGQVIIFGRDFDTKVVVFRGEGTSGWARWLASFADELETGDGFELGRNDDGSDGSEDGVGYESYFGGGGTTHKGDGGGDAGISGLRLTGEYRGWSVLEAWADRSVRRWQEAGVVPPDEPQRSSSKGKEVEEQADDASDAATLIPTVSVDPPPVSPSDTSVPGPSTSRRAERHERPKSLHKMPAPAPVLLPTADDIAPSPSDTPTGSPRRSGRSLDEEARIDIPMSIRHSGDDAYPHKELSLEVDLVAPASSKQTPLLSDEVPPAAAANGAHDFAPGASLAEDLQGLGFDAAPTPNGDASRAGAGAALDGLVVAPPQSAVTHTRKDSRI